MADERVYVIPLREEARKSPRNMKANRSMNGIRRFVSRHAKVQDVKVSEKINQAIWSSGRQKTPGKIKVRVRVDDGVAYVKAMDEMFIEKAAKREKKIETDKVVSEPALKEGNKPPSGNVAENVPEEKPAARKSGAEKKPVHGKQTDVEEQPSKPENKKAKAEGPSQETPKSSESAHEKTEGASK
jgi:ribosomal protein L31E